MITLLRGDRNKLMIYFIHGANLRGLPGPQELNRDIGQHVWKIGSLAVSEIAGWISRAATGPSKANSDSQFISELVLCNSGPALENVFQGRRCSLKRTPRELHFRLHTQVKCSRLSLWVAWKLFPPLGDNYQWGNSLWQAFREHPWVFEWGWNTFPSSIQGPGGRKRKGCSSRNQTIYVFFTLCVYISISISTSISISIYTYIYIHICVYKILLISWDRKYKLWH